MFRVRVTGRALHFNGRRNYADRASTLELEKKASILNKELRKRQTAEKEKFRAEEISTVMKNDLQKAKDLSSLPQRPSRVKEAETYFYMPFE